jgi:hypothetical protein
VLHRLLVRLQLGCFIILLLPLVLLQLLPCWQKVLVFVAAVAAAAAAAAAVHASCCHGSPLTT